MSQASILLNTTPPYPGGQMVADINAALAALGSHFAGDNDPAAFAGPFMRWADTANGRWKIRNAAGTAWIDLGPLLQEGEDPADGALFASQAWVAKQVATALDPAVLGWLSQPIGVPLPLWDHITGVTLPPTDDPRFRYIKLTADDDYNDGVLINEVVSGSAPEVTATAEINDEDSPLHGETVALINTEQAFLRPSTTSGTRVQDTFQGWSIRAERRTDGGGADVLFFNRTSGVSASYTSSQMAFTLSGSIIQADGTNGTPRIGNQTQPVHRTATAYMRIR